MSHWLSLSSSQTIFCEDEEDECCFSVGESRESSRFFPFFFFVVLFVVLTL